MAFHVRKFVISFLGTRKINPFAVLSLTWRRETIFLTYIESNQNDTKGTEKILSWVKKCCYANKVK